MLRTLYWCILVFLYWTTVVHFLRDASPVLMDGSGPMPSFMWSRLPMPDYGEYVRRQGYYDHLYSVPYYIAGLVITLIGCVGTPLLLKRLRASSANSFWSAVVVTLSLLIIMALVSDAGSLLDVWQGPRILLLHDFDLFVIVAMCKAFLPASLLSGFMAVIWGYALSLQKTNGKNSRCVMTRSFQHAPSPEKRGAPRSVAVTWIVTQPR